MLAASRSRTNVPPDNVQTAPILTFTATSTNRLCALLALLDLEANPADAPQQYTAGQEPRRVPVAPRVKQQDFAIGSHTQTTATHKTAAHPDELAHEKGQPADTAGDQQQPVERQGEYQCDAGRAENATGKKDQPAQHSIRIQFG